MIVAAPLSIQSRHVSRSVCSTVWRNKGLGEKTRAALQKNPSFNSYFLVHFREVFSLNKWFCNSVSPQQRIHQIRQQAQEVQQATAHIWHSTQEDMHLPHGKHPYTTHFSGHSFMLSAFRLHQLQDGKRISRQWLDTMVLWPQTQPSHSKKGNVGQRSNQSHIMPVLTCTALKCF